MKPSDTTVASSGVAILMSDILRLVFIALSDTVLLLKNTLFSRSDSKTIDENINLAEISDGSKYLSNLPVEIIIIILYYLSESDASNLGQLLILNKRYHLFIVMQDGTSAQSSAYGGILKLEMISNGNRFFQHCRVLMLLVISLASRKYTFMMSL